MDKLKRLMSLGALYEADLSGDSKKLLLLFLYRKDTFLRM